MTEPTPVAQQLSEFLNEVVRRVEPQLIVCAERKATAILRALVSECDREFRLPWEWSQTLSTSAVGHYDWSRFKGGPIVLFDELVHHGRTLGEQKRRLLKELESCPAEHRLVTVAFGVWDQCGDRPDMAYYGAVDSGRYEEIRDELVFFLQQHGSLLLDTEHIELPIRIQCGTRDFYDALSRAAAPGQAHSFLSGAHRTNLTLDPPDMPAEDYWARWLTPGSNSTGSVCKIRVLERSREMFSLIPIFYPNVRAVVTPEWLERLPSFVDRKRVENGPPDQVFYISALLASVELLRTAVPALTELEREHKVVPEAPPETFLHLGAMFPNVDVNGLAEHVWDVLTQARREKPQRSKRAACAGHVSNDQLFKLSARVLCRLVTEDTEEKKSWQQVMRYAEEANGDVQVPPAALPVVVDRLIDDGLVVTGIRQIRSSAGDPYVIRTFGPEGEVVSARIRQQLMSGDPECLLAI